MELRAASTRVLFTVPSGQPWTLSRFSNFGKVDTVSFVGYYKSCDIITFSNASEAKSNLNRMVAVTFESESFQRSWGRAIIIKNIFQIFREVACVNILAGNRVIFNFKVGLAARMTGSLVQVRGGPGEGRSPPLPAGALGPPARLPQGGLLPHPRGPRVEVAK